MSHHDPQKDKLEHVSVDRKWNGEGLLPDGIEPVVLDDGGARGTDGCGGAGEGHAR